MQVPNKSSGNRINNNNICIFTCSSVSFLTQEAKGVFDVDASAAVSELISFEVDKFKTEFYSVEKKETLINS